MNFATFLLLAATASLHCLTPLAMPMEMSGSGEQPGDGEGDCRVYDRPQIPMVRERELVTEIRCHLVCLEKVSCMSECWLASQVCLQLNFQGSWVSHFYLVR